MKYKFTLVEMLIVITIIMILAALLLPAIAAIQERNHKAKWRGYLGSHWLGDADLLVCSTFEDGLYSQSDWTGSNLANAGADVKKYCIKKGVSTGSTVFDIGGSGGATGTSSGRFSGKDAVEINSQTGFVVQDLPTGSVNFTQLREITLSLWLKPKGTIVKACLMGFGDVDMSSASGTVLGIDGGNKVAVWVNNVLKLTGTTIIKKDNKLNHGWYHLAVVMSASANKGTLYVNGEQEATAGLGGYTGEVLPNLYISRQTGVDGGQVGLEAWLGEIALFKRALSSSEIAEYYKFSRPLD